MKLMVALDYPSAHEALHLASQLNPANCGLKIGSELFTRCGPPLVRDLVQQGYKVFLDLKFHDIPNTVAAACTACADLGVWMINVHAAGGMKMMEAARSALDQFGRERPLLLAVTVLTSLSEDALQQMGVKHSLIEHVATLAKAAHAAGLDGVVAAALEVPVIKQCTRHSFLTVTPGIRLDSSASHDQFRVVTPQEALQLGSDVLVVGRPITQAKVPRLVVDSILRAIEGVSSQ